VKLIKTIDYNGQKIEITYNGCEYWAVMDGMELEMDEDLENLEINLKYTLENMESMAQAIFS
jgi:hypothetical protein